MKERFPARTASLIRELGCDDESNSAEITLFCSRKKRVNQPEKQRQVCDIFELKQVISEHVRQGSRLSLHVVDDCCGMTFDALDLGLVKWDSIQVECMNKKFEFLNFKAGELRVYKGAIRAKSCLIGKLNLIMDSGLNELDDCFIGNLAISNGQGDQDCDLYIMNTKMLSVRVKERPKARDILIIGGMIETRLENVRRLKEFEKEIARGLSILPDRESMAILHNWAVEKGNSAVAHLARAKELSIERMESTGFDRALLGVWGATANYGLSPLRPLLWMIGAMLTFSCLVSLTGVTVSPDITLSGWRLILTDQATFLDRFTVGLVAAAESITSPLSIFSFRRLVIVEQWWVAVIQVFYSYFCLAMIFLFGFSVRRRFRVS